MRQRDLGETKVFFLIKTHPFQPKLTTVTSINIQEGKENEGSRRREIEKERKSKRDRES